MPDSQPDLGDLPKSPRRPRRPDPRPPRTRRAILDAGYALIARDGLEAATVSAIADTAHVAVGSIYAHFPGKEALVLEVFLERAEPPFREFLRSNAALDPSTRLAEAGTALMGFAIDEPALTAALVNGQLLGYARSDDDLCRRLVALGEEALASLQRDVRQSAAARDAMKDDVASLLLVFWLGLMSALTRRDALAISAERARALLGGQLDAILAAP